MKYSNQVIINKPIGRVIELFDSVDNLYKWMPGLQSYEHISGEPGHAGAKAKLKFKMGKRDIEMIETITLRDLPHEFSATYEVKGIHNPQRNLFTAIDANTTKYESISEFEFKSFGMKLIGLIMPNAFKKQSQVYLDKFKEFVESEG